MPTLNRPKTRPTRPRENHRRIHRGRTVDERKAARVGISLRAIGISSQTERRYLSAVAKVIPFLEHSGRPDELDALCQDWIEREWARGTPLGLIGDALSGLHFFWPLAKGWLKGSWRLYRNWRKIEAPQRAPPLPWRTCRALVAILLEADQLTLAFLIALGFHTFLRTGELLRLQYGDISASDSHGVVTIRASKSGLRFNIDEAVTITDLSVLRMWSFLNSKQTPANASIWPSSPHLFRAAFHSALDSLSLSSQGFQPYSLRRGGATHLFMRRRTVDEILIRGRWRSLNVGRLYLEDGLATLQQLTYKADSQSLVTHFDSLLPPAFLL